MKKRTSPRKKNIIACVILAILVCLAFYDIVFLNKTFKLSTTNPQALHTGVYGQQNNKLAYFPVQSTDSYTFEEPVYEFLRQWLQQGVLPLWNPLQGGGYPLIAMIHFGIFWPLNFILFLLPSAVSWDIMTLSRFLVAGMSMFFLLRGLRLKTIPALSGAAIFMLSGPTLFQQYCFANNEIIGPLVLLSLENLARRPNRRTCAWAAIAVLATCLAGHPEHIFLVNAYGFFYFCFRLFVFRKRNNPLKTFGFLIAAYTLGGFVSAFVLLPFIQNYLYVFWHTHGKAMGLKVEGSGMLKEAAACLLFPRFFQTAPVTLTFSRYTALGHMGIMTFALAFLSLFSRKRRMLGFCFSAAAFIIFAKSYLNWPAINWIGSLPLFSSVRFYQHTHHLFALSLSVSAALGVRYLQTKRASVYPVALFFLVISVIAGYFLSFYGDSGHLQQSLSAAGLGVGIAFVLLLLSWARKQRWLSAKIFSSLLLALICAELIYYIPREHVNRFDSFPKIPYVEWIKARAPHSRVFGVFWTMYPNTASGYGLNDVGITHGLLCERYVNYIENFIFPGYFNKGSGRTAFRVIPAPFMPEPRPFLDLLSLRYAPAPLNFPAYFEPARNPDFTPPVYFDEVRVYEFPSALPRTFIVHKAVFEPDKEKTVTLMKKLRNGLRMVAVLEAPADQEIIAKLNNAPSSDDSGSTIVKDEPDHVVIQADMKSPGILILSDTFHPDWQASVDDKPVEIYPANYMFRGVYLNAGQHRVEFRFKPMSFTLGLWISLAGLIILLGMFWKKPIQ